MPEKISGTKVIGAPLGFRKHNCALACPPGGSALGWMNTYGEPTSVPAGFTRVAFDERFVRSTSIGPGIPVERSVRSDGRLLLAKVMIVHQYGSRALRLAVNGSSVMLTCDVTSWANPIGMPSTGVLNVIANPGSFELLASMPMQYCPGAAIRTERSD